MGVFVNERYPRFDQITHTIVRRAEDDWRRNLRDPTRAEDLLIQREMLKSL